MGTSNLQMRSDEGSYCMSHVSLIYAIYVYI